MFGSPLKKARVRREPSTPRKGSAPSTPTKPRQAQDGLLTPSPTPSRRGRDLGPMPKLKLDGLQNMPATDPHSNEPSEDVAPPTPTRETKKRRIDESETSEPSIFFQGKALFQRGSKTRGVVGRVDERKVITDKIEHCMQTRANGALYVSGLPGTGKSALVSEILGSIDVKKNTRVATINCMTIDKPDQTYALIAKEFGYLERQSQKDKQQATELLRAEFTRPDRTHILVMDELDRIVTADQEVLFRIFEWACGSTNLLMIGIANAIDLTDRFLPRLQAHQLRPQVLAFKPYTAQGITSIIEARLNTLPAPLMHPAAVRICAAKTAANSGDLRKAFDICRRAIEVVEELGEPLVTTPHVAKVCSAAFGGIDARERLQLLNFQQRAVLCVLMKTERASTVPNVTVLHAFQEYEQRCQNNPAVNSLAYPEYMEVVNALEAAGLVAVTGLCGKKGLGSHGNVRVSRGGGGAAGNKSSEGYRDEFGLRKISSRAQVTDVINELSDNDPLRHILID